MICGRTPQQSTLGLIRDLIISIQRGDRHQLSKLQLVKPLEHSILRGQSSITQSGTCPGSTKNGEFLCGRSEGALLSKPRSRLCCRVLSSSRGKIVQLPTVSP